MHELKVTIEIFSYWQVGGGEGVRPDLDATLLRCERNLPFLPGRTIKGLWREAMHTAEECGQIKPGTTTQLFGEYARPTDTEPDYSGGILHFSNGELDSCFQEWICGQDEAYKEQLFSYLSTTRLEEGIAADRMQRTIEVCVPLTLAATLSFDAENRETITKYLEKSAPLIRRFGVRRHRGLGRCRFVINQEQGGRDNV